MLKNKSEEERLPCIRTINNILHRNGLIDPEESAKRQAFQRFERETCNELWQTDFKGDFATLDGKRCYPLDIIMIAVASAFALWQTIAPLKW